MLEILKTTDKKLIELGINEAQSGSWFNLINPSYDEIQKVSLILNLDESFLRNSLDVDERSRIEIEDDCLLIITNIPIMEDEGAYDTLPLGIIFTQRGFITVSSIILFLHSTKTHQLLLIQETKLNFYLIFCSVQQNII